MFAPTCPAEDVAPVQCPYAALSATLVAAGIVVTETSTR